MSKAAIMITSRRKPATPIIPPSSGLVRPLLGEAEVVGDVLAIGAGIADSLATILRIADTVVEGAPTIVFEMIVVFTVCTIEFESVDFDV